MSDIQEALARAHREAAAVLGEVSVALARRRLPSHAALSEWAHRLERAAGEECRVMRMPPEKCDSRLAGETVRYHTELVLRRQTVAEHSWQCARVLLAIWPEAPRHVIVETLFHDTGEWGSADVPSPAKRTFPALAEAVDVAEAASRLSMALPWGLPPRATFTFEEEAVLHFVDLVEAWEFLLIEQSMGNRHARVLVERCDLEIKQMLLDLPPVVFNLARSYVERRRQTEAAR